eukprot:scaffold3747_cov240-Pinguiococcus_pyrenoidosus.AAC.14
MAGNQPLEPLTQTWFDRRCVKSKCRASKAGQSDMHEYRRGHRFCFKPLQDKLFRRALRPMDMTHPRIFGRC